MNKYYLLTIAILCAYIGATFPYTQESIRHHIAVRVSRWEELKVVQQQSEVNKLSSLMQVSMLPMKGEK